MILRIATGFIFNETFHKSSVFAQGVVYTSDAIVDMHINSICGNQFWIWFWPWLTLILRFFYIWFFSYLISTQYLSNILFFSLTQSKHASIKGNSIILMSTYAKKSSTWRKISGFLFTHSSMLTSICWATTMGQTPC